MQLKGHQEDEKEEEEEVKKQGVYDSKTIQI